jgi:hypothetical protein
MKPDDPNWGKLGLLSQDDLSCFLRHFLDAQRGGGVHNPYACTHPDAMRVWEENRVWPTAAELRGPGDPLGAELIGGLPDCAEVIDLRGGGADSAGTGTTSTAPLTGASTLCCTRWCPSGTEPGETSGPRRHPTENTDVSKQTSVARD